MLNDTHTVEATVTDVYWKRVFCFLPQVSTTSATVIWLKYAYKGHCVIAVPSKQLFSSMTMWQTESEHTAWRLGAE